MDDKGSTRNSFIMSNKELCCSEVCIGWKIEAAINSSPSYSSLQDKTSQYTTYQFFLTQNISFCLINIYIYIYIILSFMPPQSLSNITLSCLLFISTYSCLTKSSQKESRMITINLSKVRLALSLGRFDRNPSTLITS